MVSRTPVINCTGGRRGFALAEALIASVLLCVLVVGIAGTLAASSNAAMVASESATATMLARQLIEEIAGKAFPQAGVTTAPGWSAGTQSRSGYDDAADYDGYTDTTPVSTLGGGTVSVSGSYTRTVSFTQRTGVSGPSGGGDFGLVTVTVTTPSGATVQVSRLMTNVIRSR